MVNNSEFDVIIVGAGPAGKSLAYQLLMAGLKVCIVDKKPIDRIGFKVCGDALSPNYYNRLNQKNGFPKPPENAIELCDRFVIQDKSDRNELAVPSVSGTVDRLQYGQTILHELLNFQNFTLKSQTKFFDVIVEDNFIRGIRIVADREFVDLYADLVVDASGTNSVVRRKLPPEFLTKMDKSTPQEYRFVAYREIIETEEPHSYQNGLYITNQEELEDLGAAYYWVFSKGKKRANVGLGYLNNDENRGHNIREINRRITEKLFPNAKIIESQGDQIPARLPLPSCVANGFLVVGDAAGLANPLNGEGHGIALEAGTKAAEIVIDAIQSGDVSEQGLWDYNKYIWNTHGKINAWGVAVLKLMNKYGAELYDFVLTNQLITQNDIDVILNDTEQGLSIFHILKNGWRRPDILFNLYRTKRHAEKIRQLIDDYPDTPDDDFNEWAAKLEPLADYYR